MSELRRSSFVEKASLTIGFFLCILNLSAQNQISPDSLDRVYTSGKYLPAEKLKLLKELAVNHPDTERKLYFSEELIRAADVVDSAAYVFQGLLEKGNALRLKSDLSNALDSYFQAARIAERENNIGRLGTVQVAIADVYSIMGNQQNAGKFYRSATSILRANKDSVNLASALLNEGDMYTNSSKLDSALKYTSEAELIFNKIGSRIGQAYSLGNLGMIFAKNGNNRRAEDNMNKAILILEDLKEYYPIAVYLSYISDIYLQKNDKPTALSYALRSLELAQKHGMKKEVGDAYLSLTRIYEEMGRFGEAYRYYKRHIAYKDSVANIAAVQQMADLRTDFEVSRKQAEVDLLNQQKKTQQIIVLAVAVALLLIGLLAFGLYRRYQYVRTTNRIIEEERGRSEALLLNILPKETAQELKEHGKVQAKRFDSVSVLFADFKGFTQHAESLSPEELVKTVDYYFSKFDEITEKYGLEKIKTVGDAYMCAGGLPFPVNDHALKMVKAGLEMIEFVNNEESGPAVKFEVRVGMNTGPVVAGIVGTKKFAYDIWGDTVNIASRLEATGEPGRMNISESTYKLVKDQFDCEYRGELDVKNRGVMKMYFVTGPRSGAA